MNRFQFFYPDGATPIDPNEARDLIPDYISTMGELNQLEQANIARGFLWADRQDLSNLLTATFIFRVHYEMFNDVWKWAGKVRKTNKNIGVPKEDIYNELGLHLKDVQFWTDNKTYFIDELAARFHHKIVQIHLFPNGNGRHARLLTDLLLKKMESVAFSWGAKSLIDDIGNPGTVRERYLLSLKKADQDDFSELLRFVRS